ncbi:hypothetical protein E2K98_07935 [Bacillus salipaludis]|uniref:Uncharacterized protein n=1 Tax=Bacillus salipaludis TaxID=2547811 RepID=A0A4V3AU73_9BACI|nr:hypothetical protein [Bacillus salipaludis]MDQ6597188.1 hypothetical protein [Bacillus salipaludis]TDK63363.1 hypothetical protein E2K98_07935 [Bacillus salipaludis]
MGSSFLSPSVHIGTIKIGSIGEASCFSIGNNFIDDFKSNKKHSQGLGNIHGDRNNLSHSRASLTTMQEDQNKKKPSDKMDKAPTDKAEKNLS